MGANWPACSPTKPPADGEIIAIESYKDGETDVGRSISRLKTADLKRFGKSTSVQTSKGTTRTVYTPGFEALFIPGSSGQVSLLASQLVFYDVKVNLLGINAWNSPDSPARRRTIIGRKCLHGWFLRRQCG